MVGAARGRAGGPGRVGHETVDPSAVQGIPGVVSENSRPLYVVSQPLDVTGVPFPSLVQKRRAGHHVPSITSAASRATAAGYRRARLGVRLGAVGLGDAGAAADHAAQYDFAVIEACDSISVIGRHPLSTSLGSAARRTVQDAQRTYCRGLAAAPPRRHVRAKLMVGAQWLR
jgi:hypothetical protein